MGLDELCYPPLVTAPTCNCLDARGSARLLSKDAPLCHAPYTGLDDRGCALRSEGFSPLRLLTGGLAVGEQLAQL